MQTETTAALEPLPINAAGAMAEPPTHNRANDGERSYTFGTFVIDDAEFALSVIALKEVVNEPAAFTRILPAPEFFIGVFNLRGSVVPVIDLRSLLGLPPFEQSGCERKVAIIEHDGYLVGLLVDAAGNVFTACASDIFSFQPADRNAAGSVISSVFMRDNSRRIVQVLDPAALLGHEHIPLIKGLSEQAASEAGRGKRQQFLSFHVGASVCAIDMTCIKEILECEQLENQAIASDWIKGTIDLRGTTVPVIDFEAFLSGGEARTADALVGQRFKHIVLKFGTEFLSLLVDRVETIVSFEEHEVGAFPPIGLRRGNLFRGCLNPSATATVLLLDQGKVMSDPELVNVSSGCSQLFRESDATTLADQKRNLQKQTYITFTIQTRFALDILSVNEVLNFPETIDRPPNTPDCIEGLLNLRGDLIPIINPRRLFGLDLIDASSTRLLIFSSGSARYAMMVDTVGSIVSAALTDTRSMQAQADQNSTLSLSHGVKEMLVIQGDLSPGYPLMIFDLEAMLAHCERATEVKLAEFEGSW